MGLAFRMKPIDEEKSMRSLLCAIAVFGLASVGASASTIYSGDYSKPNPDVWSGGIIEAATTCFKTGEQTSGMNKICYYNCLGSTKAITISATSLCPLSIKD